MSDQLLFKMDILKACRCCLSRPPDKDMQEHYTTLGETEVFMDILKECFEINLNTIKDIECGICDACVVRLRDAWTFKKQVQSSQKELQNYLVRQESIKNEENIAIKLETLDDDSDSLYFDLKEEFCDVAGIKQDPEMLLGFKAKTSKKHRKQKIFIADTTIEYKSRPRKTIKLTLRDLKSKTKPQISTIFLNEILKHKFNIKNIIKHSNCTPFSNRTLSGYVCAYCTSSFIDPQELRDHTKTHQNEDINNKKNDKNNISVKMDITDLKCNICNKNIDVIANLKTHLTNDHDVKFYPDVNDYILEFKLKNEEMMNCALCNSAYETFKMLLQHMNGHYRNFICEICDMGFINKHRLLNHKRTHDTGDFKCSFCDKIFSTRVRKVCHEKYTHKSSARYTTNCPHCEQTFTSYYQRNRHMFTEHNTVAASYKCNICDKSFIMKSKLTSHIKKVHLMERNHTCPECGQSFFIKQCLDEHMIKHGGERVHKCVVCQKAYARKKTLREHMRIHNNDRRFKCGICSLAFVQKCSLKSHMLSNHGVTLAEFESFGDLKK